MQNKKTKAAPRVSPLDRGAKTQSRLYSCSIQFGNRSDDWLALGDWLAAGEKFKSRSATHKRA